MNNKQPIVTLDPGYDPIARKYLRGLTMFLKAELRDLEHTLLMTVEDKGHEISILTVKSLTNDQTSKVIFLTRGFDAGFKKGRESCG